MIQHRRLLALGAIATICLLSGCQSQKTTSEIPALKPLKVRLKWVHQAQFAGFYVAKDKGFYKDQGLDVTLNAGGVDFPAIQMVAGGDEDFGVTGADQLILARDKGVPVKAVAVIYRRSPMILFALAESGITTPMDFVHKRIGVKLGGNEELTYRALMKAAGVSTKRLTEVPVKYDMAPFFARQIDVWPGYLINESIVAEEKGFKINVVYPPDYGIDLYADTLFTTDKKIGEDPDSVSRFVRATIQGWRYAIEHPEEAAQLSVRYGNDLSLVHETKMMKASIPLLQPDGQPIGSMDADRWQKMEDLLINEGFLTTAVKVDAVFSSKFLP